MNYIEKEKVDRLLSTYKTNYRLTKLYSLYLEHCPDAITKEMIETLCEDGRITKSEAFIAILAEMLGIGDQRDEVEKKLVRYYLNRSVRLLDTKKYTENAYYKRMKVGDIKDGSWELKNETYPAYRAFIADDMEMLPDHTEIPPLGFFDEDFTFLAVLEDGNEWMTLTPVDLDTCEEAIERASGKVVTFGLGLGYFTFMASEKAEVNEVVVVEKSEKVAELFKKHILPRFNHPEKVRIIIDDAFIYAEKQMPAEGFDYAFVDTWRDASDGAPMYARMKRLEHLSPNTRFDYWIERFIISRIRSQRLEDLMTKIESGSEDAPNTYGEFVHRLTDSQLTKEDGRWEP